MVFKKHLRIGWRFIRYVGIHFDDDGCMYRAAALTFTSLLSLVPLMSLSFTILTAFPGFKDVGDEIETFLFQHFVADSGEIIHAYLQTFVQQASQLSLTGVLFLLFTAVLMMFTIEQALNQIWRVRMQRKGISAFLLYWAVLTLSPILLGASLVLSSYLFSIPMIAGTAASIGLSKAIILGYIPFLFAAGAFTLLYVAIPNCSVPIAHGLIGGVCAAILFEVSKFAFTLYITHFPTYKVIYGALASIPIFLIWVYMVWVIILIGAEIAQACAASYDRRPGAKLDGFTHAFRWLGHLWEAQQEGKGLKLSELVKRDSHNYEITPEEQIEALINAKLVQPTEKGKFMLSRDLHAITLGELHQLLSWQIPNTEKLKYYRGDWKLALEKAMAEYEKSSHKVLSLPVASLYTEPRA